MGAGACSRRGLPRRAPRINLGTPISRLALFLASGRVVIPNRVSRGSSFARTAGTPERAPGWMVSRAREICRGISLRCKCPPRFQTHRRHVECGSKECVGDRSNEMGEKGSWRASGCALVWQHISDRLQAPALHGRRLFSASRIASTQPSMFAGHGMLCRTRRTTGARKSGVENGGWD